MNLPTVASFICPHCKEHTSARIAGEGWFELTCQQCKRGFNTLLATQFAFLRSENCDQAQGFKIGKPMPVQAIARYLQSFVEDERAVESSADAVPAQAAIAIASGSRILDGEEGSDVGAGGAADWRSGARS